MLDDLEGVRSTIRDITHLHHVGFARGPSPSSVDHTGIFEHRDVIVVVPVNIPDGDNPLYPLPVVLNRRRQPREGKGKE